MEREREMEWNKGTTYYSLTDTQFLTFIQLNLC